MRRALPILACATLGTSASARPEQAFPDGLGKIIVGPQITCVTGPAWRCLGQAPFRQLADPGVLARAVQAGFGLRHGCLVDAEGTASCWGDDSEGQLGVDPAALQSRIAERVGSAAPRVVAGVPPLSAIAAGWLHTCALTRAGSVVCWGDNRLGQLGSAGGGPSPVVVSGMEGDVKTVAAGGEHSCAATSSGVVYCWGDGTAGQLGGGSLLDSASPVRVVGLEGPVVELAAGAYHSCARLAGGTVACWGDNRFGQLGDGSHTSSATPVAVAGLGGRAIAIRSGYSFSCALLQDGAVECWGANEMGELGDGLFSPAPDPGAPAARPTRVPLAGKATVLAAAGAHACAELEGGRVQCWGANESGQLGDGTVEPRDRPVDWQARSAAVPRPPSLLTSARPETVEGLDVSYHSGKVDWERAAGKGHRFALTLATAGVDFRDPYFATHWERMRQAGLVRGAYHFFVVADDPDEQADTFLSHVRLEPGDLAPVVDVETLGKASATDLARNLRRFLERVEAATGVKPIIYTGPNFWNRTVEGDFGDYPLWIAEYGVDQPTVPKGWKRWHLWQWRGNADLPEVAPIVDLDRLHPEVDIRELLIPEPKS